jgi:hypothetical protein
MSIRLFVLPSDIHPTHPTERHTAITKAAVFSLLCLSRPVCSLYLILMCGDKVQMQRVTESDLKIKQSKSYWWLLNTDSVGHVLTIFYGQKCDSDLKLEDKYLYIYLM